MAEPARLAIIGAGQRGRGTYAGYCKLHPQDARVIAIADPVIERREGLAREHGLRPDDTYESWEQLLDARPAADAVVVATPDRQHVAPATTALELGYEVLLEKPIAPTEAELLRLARTAASYPNSITVAHVLRYTPFFATIKELVVGGRIGQLLSIQHSENIGYWHFAHSYVRGNWANAGRATPMILAKSCHDLDLIRWIADSPWKQISSFGELSHFRAERAPEGAPERCLDGCPVFETCPFNAVRYYVEALEGFGGWPVSAITDDLTTEGRLRALREGPYGRCVYRSDNDVVDHQVAIVEFANGVNATLNVCAATSEITRTLKVTGSAGEIRGHMGEGEIEVRDFHPLRRGQRWGGSSDGQPPGTDPEVIRVPASLGHGGGDEGIMRAFVDRIRARDAGHQDVEALTSLTESLDSHLMAFAAERSRIEGRVVCATSRGSSRRSGVAIRGAHQRSSSS